MSRKILLIILFVSMGFVSKAQDSRINHWESLFYPDAPLKYILPIQEPDSSWNSLDFNDSTWGDILSAVGSGEMIDLLVEYNDFPPLSLADSVSIYTRTYFTILDTSKVEQIMLDIFHEDGMVAYINGTEVARRNIGIAGEKTTFDQLADTCLFNDIDFYYGNFLPGYIIYKEKLSECLINGTNVLAIELHNDAYRPEFLNMINFTFIGMRNEESSYFPMETGFPVKVELDSTQLPIVEISPSGYGQLIGNEQKITQSMKIIDKPGNGYNKPNDAALGYNGKIGIELRGSSSLFMFPEKSYSIETRNSIDDNLSVSLLGMPEENDWVLYGPYGDRTLIRNSLSYSLARSLGGYVPRNQFVELIRNGSLMGVYALTEKIKKDQGRVDISTLRPDEIAGDSLTGGYIIKIDKREGNYDGFQSKYGTSDTAYRGKTFIQYVYPKYNEIVDEQKVYIKEFMDSFESSLRSEQFEDEELGYRRYIDVPSFIDFLIINELNRNVDGYRISTFMYKDKVTKGGKLHMGPVWDFNLAFGNADYCHGDWIEGWSFDYNLICGDQNEPPFWWDRLLQDPSFVSELDARWNEVRNNQLSLDSIYFKIDSLTNYLGEARVRNFAIWQDVFTEYIWPHEPAPGNSYESEIDYLKSWISDRVVWIDDNIATVREKKYYVGLESPMAEKEFMPVSVYPNPFVDVANISIELERKHHLQVQIFNFSGMLLANLVNEELPGGHYNFQWDGSTLSGGEIQSGVYAFIILVDGSKVHAGKLIKH